MSAAQQLFDNHTSQIKLLSATRWGDSGQHNNLVGISGAAAVPRPIFEDQAARTRGNDCVCGAPDGAKLWCVGPRHESLDSAVLTLQYSSFNFSRKPLTSKGRCVVRHTKRVTCSWCRYRIGARQGPVVLFGTTGRQLSTVQQLSDYMYCTEQIEESF